jgi:hypothetical protein
MGEVSARDWTSIAIAGVSDDESKEDNGDTNGETKRTIPKELLGLDPRGSTVRCGRTDSGG